MQRNTLKCHYVNISDTGMYAHQAAAVRDKLIVFGGDFGVHHRNLSNDIYIFELGTCS
jgi:hypothetical protein